jgi:hypothetical protein
VSPGEPDPAAERPRPLLGLGFWAVMVFAMLCVLAGVGVVLLGPKLWPPAPTPAPAPAVQSAPQSGATR